MLKIYKVENNVNLFAVRISGRSQNTVPIASTQVAIKGIVQYSTRTVTDRHTQSREQLATRHS